MMEQLKPKALIIGGGPGGYVAAIRAGQLGLDTVLVDAVRLGGTCLVRGCIPSKALIHAASIFATMTDTARRSNLGIHLPAPPSLDFGETVRWKDGIVDQLSGGVATLLKRAGVRVVRGWAAFDDAKTCTVEGEDGRFKITAEHVILATGSKPVELSVLPFGGRVISSTEALSLPALPKHLVVVGAGYIGLELGIAFRKLGVEVTVVEAGPQILPHYDKKLTDPVMRWLQGNGVTIHLNATVTGEVAEGVAATAHDGASLHLPADVVLVTAGRTPLTSGWGLEKMNLAMDGRFVAIDDKCATSTHNVWAIGDLVGEPMLAHKASAQGAMVAEIIAGERRQFSPAAIPAVCFTEPEIVSVGIGPDTEGSDTISGVFPFAANGRALSMRSGGDGGFTRVIARASDHRILGIQSVGAHVSELSAQFVSLIEMGAVLEDVEGMIHAHPTLGEATHEASLKALGHAIHF